MKTNNLNYKKISITFTVYVDTRENYTLNCVIDRVEDYIKEQLDNKHIKTMCLYRYEGCVLFSLYVDRDYYDRYKDPFVELGLDVLIANITYIEHALANVIKVE